MPTTIENLKTAITGESKACAKYSAYATRAAQEGYPQIQKMFEAAAKAERIHATNHNKVLVKLGCEPIDLDMEMHICATVENLKDALAGEIYEFTDMYPPMIAEAEAEGIKDAVRSFTWAMEAEKGHAKFYGEALRQLEAGEKLNLPEKYYVCPLCGDTYDAANAPDKCNICGLPKAKYIEI